MNSVLRKLQVSVTQQALVLNQALALHRYDILSNILAPGIGDDPWSKPPSCIRHPVWAAVNERQYRSMPTHGIGRWRHLIPKEAPKKKKDRHQMKPIMAATDTAYGTLNVIVSGYDMTVVEHYSQYIHNLCNRLDIKVADCYALPTKFAEVMLMQEQGTKMHVDQVLTSHERVVQVSTLNASLCPVFMEVLLKNQPEGVQLSVKEHTEADFHARFKGRPELEELMSQMSQQTDHIH